MLPQASKHKDAWAETEAEPGDVPQSIRMHRCLTGPLPHYEPNTKSLSKFESYCLAKMAHTNMLKQHTDFLFRTSYALQSLKVRIHTTHNPILRKKWVVQCGSWSSVTRVQLCAFHSRSGKWRNNFSVWSLQTRKPHSHCIEALRKWKQAAYYL